MRISLQQAAILHLFLIVDGVYSPSQLTMGSMHALPRHTTCAGKAMEGMRHVTMVAMVTLSNGNILCVTGPLCGEFTCHRWIPLTKASDAELWCFIYSAPKQRLSKQSRRRWFGTPSHSLWRHCNGHWWDLVPWSPNFSHKISQNDLSHETQIPEKFHFVQHSYCVMCILCDKYLLELWNWEKKMKFRFWLRWKKHLWNGLQNWPKSEILSTKQRCH